MSSIKCPLFLNKKMFLKFCLVSKYGKSLFSVYAHRSAQSMLKKIMFTEIKTWENSRPETQINKTLILWSTSLSQHLAFGS